MIVGRINKLTYVSKYLTATIFLNRLPLSFMMSQQQNGTLSALNVAIEALNLTKEVSLKPVFGSVSALLTMIRVHCLEFCGNGLLAYIYPGLDGKRTGLRRTWAELR